MIVACFISDLVGSEKESELRKELALQKKFIEKLIELNNSEGFVMDYNRMFESFKHDEDCLS